MNLHRVFKIVLMIGLLPGCPILSESDGKSYRDENQVASFDGVKTIAESITDPLDPQSMDQKTIDLHLTRRALVIYKKTLEIEPNVRTEDGHKVELVLAVRSDPSDAAKNLKVCAIKKLWSMRATWNHPHGFKKQGWDPGGSFDESLCFKGVIDPIQKSRVRFDITLWFLNYVRARRIDLGLLVISDGPTTILGSQDTLDSPRLEWVQSRVN